MLPELPATYYHDNFNQLINQVAEVYWDLLTQQEQQFIDDYRQLGDNAQQLYIRLLCRKGELFRIDKLSYAEIEDLPAAIQQLDDMSFAVRIDGKDTQIEESGIDEYDLINLYNKAELLNWLASDQHNKEVQQNQPKKSIKRDELDGQILFWLEEGDLQLDSLILDNVLLVYGELEFTTYRLMYFGNLHQDFTDFVLNDLGIYQYENYRIDRQTRLFNNRRQIDDYLEYYDFITDLTELKAYEIEELVELAQSVRLMFERLPCNDLDCEYADIRQRHRLQHQLNELARELERRNAFNPALEFYQLCELPPARERQARILTKLERFEHAWVLVLNCFHNPYNEQERQFAITFTKSLVKKLDAQIIDSYLEQHNKQAFWANKQSINEVRLLLPMDDIWSEHGVEIAAATAIEELRSGDCFFVENTLINSVFGLYFWDLIFADVQGAFVHPFQFRPLDLYEPEFFQRRQHLSEYQTFEEASFKQKVLHKFETKHGIASLFVFWNGLERDLLELALDRIPAEHWQALFARMWADIKHNRAGLPDLIFFPEQQAENTPGYELIEIKGPGDTLQKNQKGWLEYFQGHNIPYSVAYVSILDSDTASADCL